MNRIRRVSFYLRTLFQIIIVVLPIIALIQWIAAPKPIVLMHNIIVFDSISKLGYPVLHTLGFGEKFCGFLLNLIPLGINLLALGFLVKLFSLYEKGEIFSLKNVAYIRNIGYALLVGQLINPFYEMLMGLVLTLGNPPGQRMIAVTVNGTNLRTIVISVMIILISWIMTEGYKLREEQQLTV